MRTILRHLAGQRTLVLAFDGVSGHKPTVVTHQDIIAESFAMLEHEKESGERHVRHERMKRHLTTREQHQQRLQELMAA